MNRTSMLAMMVTTFLLALSAVAYVLFGIEFAVCAVVSIGFGILIYFGRQWRYGILAKIDAQSEHLRAVTALSRIVDGPPIYWSPHALSPETLYLILHLLEGLRSYRVLELGSGASTIIVANFFKLRGVGTIQSFDHDQRWARSAATKLEARGLGAHGKIADVSLRDIKCRNQNATWYDIPGAVSRESFDFVIVDGPPSWQGNGLARLPALYEVSKMMTETAVLVLDDADRGWESEVARCWKEDFPDFHFRKVNIGRGLLVVSKSNAVFDLLP